MKGICGYGRYNDDPNHVGCPRAKSDMTPCIARDGKVALADDQTCVACEHKPGELLGEICRSVGMVVDLSPVDPDLAAERLRDIVREITEPLTLDLPKP